MSLRSQEVESSDNDANNYKERFDNVTLFVGIIYIFYNYVVLFICIKYYIL